MGEGGQNAILTNKLRYRYFKQNGSFWHQQLHVHDVICNDKLKSIL